MKKLIAWLVIFTACMVIFGVTAKNTSASFPIQGEESLHLINSALPEITPMPTDLAPVASIDPADRTLPPIGRNSGLVMAASVLVLIIIGGVLGSRRRLKH
jgi:hypothetical protein